jgi:hypothetical protein
MIREHNLYFGGMMGQDIQDVRKSLMARISVLRGHL